MSARQPRSRRWALDSRFNHTSVINFGVVSLQIPPSSICRLSAVVLWKIEKQIEFACNPPQPSANANSPSRSVKQLCSRPGGHTDLRCRLIDGAAAASLAACLHLHGLTCFFTFTLSVTDSLLNVAEVSATGTVESFSCLMVTASQLAGCWSNKALSGRYTVRTAYRGSNDQ